MLVAILYLYVQTTRRPAAWTFDYDDAVARWRCRARPQLLLLRRLRAGLRHQGAAVPAAHLAARRARRGADRRLGDPGRRAAEVRHLRLPALRHAVVPAARRRGCAPLHRHPGGHRHRLRLAGGLRAGRRQEAGRLLVGGAPRLRGARAHDVERRRGIDGAIYQMLAHGISTGGLFLVRRRPLRAPPHAPDRRVRRPVGARCRCFAALLPGHHAGVGRPARPSASSASS